MSWPAKCHKKKRVWPKCAIEQDKVTLMCSFPLAPKDTERDTTTHKTQYTDTLTCYWKRQVDLLCDSSWLLFDVDDDDHRHRYKSLPTEILRPKWDRLGLFRPSAIIIKKSHKNNTTRWPELLYFGPSLSLYNSAKDNNKTPTAVIRCLGWSIPARHIIIDTHRKKEILKEIENKEEEPKTRRRRDKEGDFCVSGRPRQEPLAGH